MIKDEQLEIAYQTIVDYIRHCMNVSIEEDSNFEQTPQRCVRALKEFIGNSLDIQIQLQSLFSKTFDAKYDEMVTERDINVISLCPHHLLPVEMKVTIAYIPNKKVLGLSKLARIAQLLGRQAVLQEDYTQSIVNLFEEHLHPKGVGIIVSGKHGCMSFRGVKTTTSDVITTAFSGAFKENLTTRNEFLSLFKK